MGGSRLSADVYVTLQHLAQGLTVKEVAFALRIGLKKTHCRVHALLERGLIESTNGRSKPRIYEATPAGKLMLDSGPDPARADMLTSRRFTQQTCDLVLRVFVSLCGPLDEKQIGDTLLLRTPVARRAAIETERRGLIERVRDLRRYRQARGRTLTVWKLTRYGLLRLHHLDGIDWSARAAMARRAA